jgi:hypothetical protein
MKTPSPRTNGRDAVIALEALNVTRSQNETLEAIRAGVERIAKAMEWTVSRSDREAMKRIPAGSRVSPGELIAKLQRLSEMQKNSTMLLALRVNEGNRTWLKFHALRYEQSFAILEFVEDKDK